MFSFDLKSGYHHVDVVKCHRKYLGFGSYYSTLYMFVVDCLENLMSSQRLCNLVVW